MMNASIFLVPAVHEIAAATEFAITTRAAKKPDSHALTHRPALNTSADGIYPSYDFMARDARPIDGKGPLDRASVGVANATGLHPNPHLTGTGINQRFHCGLEFAGFRDLNCFVRCAHKFRRHAHSS
jgi:hypothetical protein